MTDAKHTGLPVKGYQSQSAKNVDLVNANKVLEEIILRNLDDFEKMSEVDKRWLAVARTHVEQGFMAMNRAIFKPGRITLPEDGAPE